MTQSIRKFIKPAHPEATIPDPDHGCDLPPEGCEVAWTSHWIMMEARGEIEVSDIASAETPGETPAETPDEPPA